MPKLIYCESSNWLQGKHTTVGGVRYFDKRIKGTNVF